MKTMNRRTHFWAMALMTGALASGCASQSPVRQHPELADAARRIKTVAILPPDVAHERVVFSGDNERLTERERLLARELVLRLRTQFEDRKYVVRGVTGEESGEPAAETVELQRLRGACNEAIRQLYSDDALADDNGQRRVSIGAVVNPVAEQMQADALLLVRYAGYEKSGGQQAKDMTATILFGTLLTVASGGAVVPMNMPAKSGGIVQLVLIDGTTGDVLWANVAQGPTDQRTTGRGWSRRTESGMSLLVRSALVGLPEKTEVSVQETLGRAAQSDDVAGR